MTARALHNVLTVEDMRTLARQRVPRMFFDYCDSGSWNETTLKRNESDLARFEFRQRVAVDIADRSLETSMVGQPVSMPVALAPVGMTGMHFPDGEIEVARAAVKAGVPYCLSTMSICPLEAVAEAIDAPVWFQLYVMRDREFVKNMIVRAKDAQCSALMVTLDLQVIGQRHADIRNRLAAPPKPSVSAAIQLATRPRWCWRMLKSQYRTFGNIYAQFPDMNNLASMADWTAKQFDPHLTWENIRWIRDLWQGPLILKGILDAEDAKKAHHIGADALVVSNHGGRQLDGAPSSISKLSSIVDVVGDKMEVHLDGGIRSGQDVLKALALGAKGIYMGRPYIYGLGVAGELGVTHILNIIRNELDLSMAFCGRTRVHDIDRSLLENPWVLASHFRTSLDGNELKQEA